MTIAMRHWRCAIIAMRHWRCANIAMRHRPCANIAMRHWRCANVAMSATSRATARLRGHSLAYSEAYEVARHIQVIRGFCMGSPWVAVYKQYVQAVCSEVTVGYYLWGAAGYSVLITPFHNPM